MRKPSAPVAQLSFEQIKELQQLLVKAGYDVGKVDGVLGQQTRSAVKAMQVKYGLPAIPGRPRNCWRGCAATPRLRPVRLRQRRCLSRRAARPRAPRRAGSVATLDFSFGHSGESGHPRLHGA